MNKIFKYTFEGGKAFIPNNSTIIRMDHVDDGQYLGDFVWVIVDTDDLDDTVEVSYEPEKYSLSTLRDKKNEELSEVDCIRQQISVQEKQIVENLYPEYVEDQNGLLYVFGERFHGRKFELAFFKTGQEIDINLEEYTYIGLCRLWIVQELGLYTFVKEIKKDEV